MSKAWLLAIAMMSLVACNGGDGSGDGGFPVGWAGGGGNAGSAGGVTDAQITDIIGLVCERARTCCMREGFDTSPLAACETELRQSDGYLWLGRGRVRVIEPNFSQCIQQARAMIGDCDLRYDPMSMTACGRIVEGTVAPGGACDDAMECASTGEPVVCLRTEGTPDDEPGVCRQLTRGRIGEGCLISANDLLRSISYSTFESEAMLSLRYCHNGDNLHCDFATHACTAFLAAGAPCSGSDSCEPELFCDGTCQPRRPAGGACTSGIECEVGSLLCREGICTQVTYGDTDICEGDLD